MAYFQNGYAEGVANDIDMPNRIRELRDARGWSQAELGRVVNADASTINKLEMGKRGLDQNWMRRLARAFEVAPVDLLPDCDNPYRLAEKDRELVERLELASPQDREYFDKVADAILPYRGPPQIKGKVA